ncbi:hypothetical protein PG994_001760 [Apiospora phragmitis]|uniref:Uncharacterized protein n=1 Tax=Apiospora phragmitis TaxID=2905665 RepID=A0ABR1WUG5_9PEZI
MMDTFRTTPPRRLHKSTSVTFFNGKSELITDQLPVEKPHTPVHFFLIHQELVSAWIQAPRRFQLVTGLTTRTANAQVLTMRSLFCFLAGAALVVAKADMPAPPPATFVDRWCFVVGFVANHTDIDDFYGELAKHDVDATPRTNCTNTGFQGCSFFVGDGSYVDLLAADIIHHNVEQADSIWLTSDDGIHDPDRDCHRFIGE